MPLREMHVPHRTFEVLMPQDPPERQRIRAAPNRTSPERVPIVAVRLLHHGEMKMGIRLG